MKKSLVYDDQVVSAANFCAGELTTILETLLEERKILIEILRESTGLPWENLDEVVQERLNSLKR